MQVNIIQTVESYNAAMSPSRQQKFEVCPASIGYEKLQGLKAPSTKGQELGKQVHAYLSGQRTGISPEALQILQKCTFPQFLVDLIKQAKEKYLELHLAFDNNKQSVDFNSPQAVVRGVLDMVLVVQDTIYIIDYKPYIGAANDWQMQTYMAFMSWQGHKQVRGFYVEYPSGQYKEILATDSEYVWFCYKAHYDIFREMTEYGFEANPDIEICSKCAAKGTCPAYANEVKIIVPRQSELKQVLSTQIGNLEQAQAVGKFILWADPLIDHAKALLKEYHQKTGQSIETEGYIWSSNISEKQEIDSYGLLQELHNRDIPVDEILKEVNITKTAWKRIVKAFPEAEGLLEKYIMSTKEVNTFKATKVKEAKNGKK